jgi:predicted dienelactone hydrolase
MARVARVSGSYDPFARGRFPVGVMTVEVGAGGARRVPVEMWYPAAESARGAEVDRYRIMAGVPEATQRAARDAAVAAGGATRWPLVVFSHGLGGHRRQSTFLCTHLASHGFVVAAPEHVGTTFPDAITVRAAGLRAWVESGVGVRPRDVVGVVDALLSGAIPAAVDAARIGVCGHSFGGWTALTAVARDARMKAVVAITPAGGRGGEGMDVLSESVELGWSRPVPTLIVGAEEDSILLPETVRDLYARAHSPKRLYMLAGADHMHVLDDPRRAHDLYRVMPVVFGPLAREPKPFGALVGATEAHAALRGLTLAWLAAHVAGDEAARKWLGGDVVGELAAHGVRAT